MGSLIYFYGLTMVWIAVMGVLALWFNEWFSPSMRRALIFRLVGWLTLFIAFIRRMGWSDGSLQTLGGDSTQEVMDGWVFALMVSVGLFCLFVAWIRQYIWTGALRKNPSLTAKDFEPESSAD